MKWRTSNKYKRRSMCTIGKHKDDREGFVREVPFKILYSTYRLNMLYTVEKIDSTQHWV